MPDFATSPQFIGLFRDDVIWRGNPDPDLAAAAVSSKAFTKAEAEWYLVEPIDGQFDRLADVASSRRTRASKLLARTKGSMKCQSV